MGRDGNCGLRFGESNELSPHVRKLHLNTLNSTNLQAGFLSLLLRDTTNISLRHPNARLSLAWRECATPESWVGFFLCYPTIFMFRAFWQPLCLSSYNLLHLVFRLFIDACSNYLERVWCSSRKKSETERKWWRRRYIPSSLLCHSRKLAHGAFSNLRRQCKRVTHVSCRGKTLFKI